MIVRGLRLSEGRRFPPAFTGNEPGVGANSLPSRSGLLSACTPPLKCRSPHPSQSPSSLLSLPFPPAFICRKGPTLKPALTFFHLSLQPLPWGSSDVEAVKSLRQGQFNTTNIYPTPPPCQALSQAWGLRRDDSAKGRAGDECPVCRDRNGKGGPVRG